MNKISVEYKLGDKIITLQTGHLALQATVAIFAKMGDTQVLVTIVEGKNRDDLGYFPLTVEFVERLYAGGRIKGSRWVKREGRPSDESILTARLIDRSVRPLFPKEYKKEVQIVVTLLSVDGENESSVLSLVAVSAALAISKIPWSGPVGAVRIAAVLNSLTGSTNYIVNPKSSEITTADLDLIVSQTKEKVYMIEAGALQVSEEIAMEALKIAHEENGKIIDFIEGFAKEHGQQKTIVSPDTSLKELIARIEKTYKEEILAMIPLRATKEADASETEQLITKIFEEEKTNDVDSKIDKKIVAKAFESIMFNGIRENVVNKSKRADGRKMDEVRSIFVEAGILSRTHGSAIFQRGNTQGLSVVTLGSPRMEQLIESAEGEESRRYIHHYSMPPYSVGEAGRMGTPSRREIGHGALAERAIMAVIPSQDIFPYTIRVVSEILSSNGSTSMAATCGSTLALMDAGVPIKKPVAGIAMGMMSIGDKYVILTDIIGLEDFSGDMDLKVAGTDSGITAIQLDVKVPVTLSQISETLELAKKARLFILEKMLAVISAPRSTISAYAPKIEMIKIPVEKIGEVIGPGGRVIKNIIAKTGAQVDVEDDGSVTISSLDGEAVEKAVNWIKGLTRELVVGEEFDGTVRRILPFGAFVEVLPGKEGMVHVSQMANRFVKDPTEIVQIGQVVKVRVAEIDEQGRVNLSMLFGEDAKKQNKLELNENIVPVAINANIENNTTPAQVAVVAPHPLSMQFRRERMEKSGTDRRGGGFNRGGSRSGSGSRSGGSRFR
ncbi:polyribonucleotide nucleotidyltransferase [Candidatus Levyibacteriota bacterium]|nr:polyribonucleotide nucleotidyltransferase [Candidatus Levybacteria bacterium]